VLPRPVPAKTVPPSGVTARPTGRSPGASFVQPLLSCETASKTHSAALAVTAGYLYVDSRALGTAADGSLAGKWIPQVPRNQATLELMAWSGPFRVNLLGRYSAAQWEDDINALRLPGFTTLDAQAAYALGSALEVFLAGENLTGRRVVTGRTRRRISAPASRARRSARAVGRLRKVLRGWGHVS
jgi:outer membrane receptor protein involved in Fe transport